MTVSLLIFLGLMLFLSGAICLMLYMVYRMVSSKNWDDSNMTNALRLISHTTVHPEDYLKMYYLTEAELTLLRENNYIPQSPFWYVDKDEFSEVVKTRPNN